MNTKIGIFSLLIPSTEFEYGAILCGDTIRFEYYRNKNIYKSGIKFSNIRAKSTRSIYACTPWHIDGTYDTLCSVSNSRWINEIMTDSAEYQRRHGVNWNLNHYMVFFDETGCIEIAAESWGLLPEEAGSWT